jgi:hypothetical protein
MVFCFRDGIINLIKEVRTHPGGLHGLTLHTIIEEAVGLTKQSSQAQVSGSLLHGILFHYRLLLFLHSLIELGIIRSSDSDFSQDLNPGTWEIPLLSLWLGAIEAQWFRLQPGFEARDLRDSPTLTVVGCHWGPVIPTSARIWSPGPGRFPYSHCGWVPLRPSDSDFSQDLKPGTGEIPLFSLWLGAIEAQWFRLQPGFEARDRGDSPTHFKWSQGVCLIDFSELCKCNSGQDTYKSWTEGN